jgi:hypothetical protein
VMEDRPLPASGKDRKIFLTALRDFSNKCEAPELTPYCPFYERTVGGPVCGEQCQDILASQQATEADGGISLGEGLALHARRRRPRRGPDESVRPFDAAEIRLRDKDRPTDVKHTVSIITDLLDEIPMPPAMSDDIENRRYVAKAGVDELVGRGFDRNLISAAIAERLSSVVLIWVGMPLMNENVEQQFSGRYVGSDWLGILDEWKQSQTLPDTRAVDLYVRFVRGPTLDLSRRWFYSLSLSDLLEWKAPTRLSDMADLPVVDSGLQNRASWLCDRFTKTYLHDWSDAGLHLEWLYVHGGREGCSVPRQMSVRKIEADAIARELAHRSSESWRQSGSPESRSFQATDFIDVAIEKLRAGQSVAAASIYEGLYALSPDDGDVTNNLGFCLVPHDLKRALEILDRAWSMSGRRNLVTLANRIFVLRRLGRTDDAVKEAALLSDCSPRPNGAYLWTTDENGDVCVVYEQDLGNYIARQLLAVEEAGG